MAKEKPRKHKDIVERMKRIQAYVKKRLQAELGPDPPHGAQADLARKLGVAGPHLSNILAPKTSPNTRGGGEYLQRAAAKMWGLSYAQLEALAMGEAVPQLARRNEIAPLDQAIKSAKETVDHPGVILDRAIEVHRKRFVRAEYERMSTLEHLQELLAEYERQRRIEARRGVVPEGEEPAAASPEIDDHAANQ